MKPLSFFARSEFTVLAASVLLVTIMALLASPALAAASNYPSLFGTAEVRSKNMKAFPKWTGLLERYFDEADVPDGDCSATEFNQCHLKYWGQFLENVQGASRLAQLKSIHRYMNESRYIVDPRNWNLKDYWATPKQFFDRDGDCEDYAIAKFMSLRALGWRNDQLRIVVLQDENLGIAHAILVAYLDGEAWVLDNQIENIIKANRILHYKPYYSINEDGWWLHRS
jgi:predicted transglutaminase-like cysteine proteinase